MIAVLYEKQGDNGIYTHTTSRLLEDVDQSKDYKSGNSKI